MVGHDKPNAPASPSRISAFAFSLLDTLLHHNSHSPNSKAKVAPRFLKRSRDPRSAANINGRGRREPSRGRRDSGRDGYSRGSARDGYSRGSARDGYSRGRREGSIGGEGRREGSTGGEGHSPNAPVSRSNTAKQLKSGWSKLVGQNSVNTRGHNAKVAVNDKNDPPPDVVGNFTYDVLEKKTQKSDYGDSDEHESDDFDNGLNEEDEKEDDFDFELKPFISEDEDEMAYFSNRSGGSDFKQLRRHVLHPHGRIRAIWDTTTLILTTWVLIIVPFELCFNMNDSFRRSILHLDLFIDAMFTVGIILNFNTAVEDDGKLHFSLSSIFRHYTRGWFMPEVLWTVPFYAIFESHDPQAYVSRGTISSPLFRLAQEASWLYSAARCLRLTRVVGLPRLQRRLEYSLLISSKVSSLGSFLFVVVTLSHVFSCVFAYLAFNDDDQLDYAINNRILQDSELKTRYIAAFYWSMMTMTTVGYGDITIKTNAGRLFSLAAMVVGAGVFAYGITNVVSLFQQLYESDTAYRREMDQVNDFMQARMLPRALRDKVRANTFHWRKAARGEDKERDRAIVERMASLIRSKVADRFCEVMMPRKMPFLAGCSAEFVHDLYLRMRVECYLPGEDIITQGDFGSEMYFLFVGHVQVLLGLTKVALFGPNSCFGEFSIANPRKPRLATIQALDFCETHCIDREQILRILLSHPITMRSARQLSALRSRKALTLIYESGGKSRTLLQGLAMMWRTEGVQGILPAGVHPDSLPFLQEFTATPIPVGPAPSRRSSAVLPSAAATPRQQFLAPQHNLDPALVLQLQQLKAIMASQTSQAVPSTAVEVSGTESTRRLSLALDPTIATTVTQQGLPTVPLHQRSRNGLKLPKINSEAPATLDPLTGYEAATAPMVVNTMRRSSVNRRLSNTNLTATTTTPPAPQTPAAPPQDDRLELLLTEIRNVASRQNELELQLKALVQSVSSKPEMPVMPAMNSTGRLDSGILARFDEQQWIDGHAPPLIRERSGRNLTRQLVPDNS